jgi:hypothetical protein
MQRPRLPFRWAYSGGVNQDNMINDMPHFDHISNNVGRRALTFEAVGDFAGLASRGCSVMVPTPPPG